MVRTGIESPKKESHRDRCWQCPSERHPNLWAGFYLHSSLCWRVALGATFWVPWALPCEVGCGTDPQGQGSRSVCAQIQTQPLRSCSSHSGAAWGWMEMSGGFFGPGTFWTNNYGVSRGQGCSGTGEGVTTHLSLGGQPQLAWWGKKIETCPRQACKSESPAWGSPLVTVNAKSWAHPGGICVSSWWL